MLVLDRWYFQTRVIINKSIEMIWREIDAIIIFCKFLKKIGTFSSFMCLLTLFFYMMQFHASYFTFICYQLILIIGFVPKIKYLCFDLLIWIYDFRIEISFMPNQKIFLFQKNSFRYYGVSVAKNLFY